MPPVVGAAAVTAGSQLAGAVLGSRANSKAAKVQDQAAQRAEAIAIENEKRRRQEYDQQIAMEKAQWDAAQAQAQPLRDAQNSLLGQAGNRLGLSIGQIAARPFPGSAVSSGAPANRPMTLARLAGGYVKPGVDVLPIPAQRMGIADIGNWGGIA